MTSKPVIDAGSFWKLLAAIPRAVPIVAARDAEGPAGLLGLSATHVSAAPPTMLVAVGNNTSALRTISASNAFAINYLPAGAERTADMFGGKTDISGSERFLDGQWTSLTTGSPVFASAVLAMDCVVERMVEHQGTQLIVGRVVDSLIGEGAEPMFFMNGRYRAADH